jgi:hypothetical protein
MCLQPHTACFFETLTKKQAWQKRNPLPGKLLKKVTQKDRAVFLIPGKGKLAKIS